MTSINDKLVRAALIARLRHRYARDGRPVRIVEELGLEQGTVRIDIAVINGAMQGYEIKSDRDTLRRLPEQMKVYNSVFSQVTVVVGKSHLYDVIHIVPEWWGIVIAKLNSDGTVCLGHIRNPGHNPGQSKVSIAGLLWREEALGILEEENEARGFRSKPRSEICEKLASVLDKKTLQEKVRQILLFSRQDWRSGSLLPSDGD